MDDLDHSVLIAEQEWDCFCADSEECSVQQVKLAVLDDSGLSDTDDDKTSINVSQTRPTAEEEKQCPAAECEHDRTHENPQFTEYSNLKNEPAGETCDAQLNNQEAISEYFSLDDNKTNDESSLAEPLNSVINNLGENDESQEENKSSQADKLVLETFLQCNQNITHENGTERTEPVTVLTDSSPVQKKEKERWFVTVNDSPVRLREKVGQKKRRKKKPSRNLNQQSEAIHKSSLNNNTEAEKEIFERQTMQHKFEQPQKSGTYLHNARKENDSYDSHSTHDLQGFAHPGPITNNVVHLINNTGEESPRFILGASTPTAPSDSDGEKTEQDRFFEQSCDAEELSSPQETPCLESSSNRAKTPDEALGPTRPIFAISSFWDEMEKWTINDILELRTANNNSSLRESIIPEECNSVDTLDAHVDGGEVDYKGESVEDGGLVDDAEDSDYFTHVEDCKPDRSSCEFSTFSDYDEEFLQRLQRSTNPTPEPHEDKEQTQRLLESTCAKSLHQEKVLEEIWPSYQSESNEIVRLYPESGLPLHVDSGAETQMQDMLLTTTQDNNTSSFLLNQCEIRRVTPSPVLSISDVLENQCLLSLFEILKNDTESEQYRTRTPDRHTSVVSVPFPQNPSVPETYDDFFSEFEIGNFLFPAVQSTTRCGEKTVPIYSSSRSVVRDLAFTEVVQSESEDKNMPIQVTTHFNSKPRCASSSGSPSVCFIANQRNTWRNLSLRRIKFSFLGRTWCGMATSWVPPKTLPADTDWNIGTTSNLSITQTKLPVMLLENQSLGYSTEQQMHVESTVSELDRDRFRFSLKQADMCLVCIAFASWVLKSTNQQSTDMWKAALLANVSAISAIQYLRHT